MGDCCTDISQNVNTLQAPDACASRFDVMVEVDGRLYFTVAPDGTVKEYAEGETIPLPYYTRVTLCILTDGAQRRERLAQGLRDIAAGGGWQGRHAQAVLDEAGS